MIPIDKNGRMTGVRYVPARVIGGEIKPRMIVLHDTAGRLNKGSSVDWFKSPECKVSAHFVIERDGFVTQMVPLNRKAAHAGTSSWNGRKYCNGFSIGIEIVNPGKLDADGRAWFHMDAKGRPREPGYDLSEIVAKKTKEHGDGLWMPYTDAQVAAVKSLCRAIVEHYADCNEIVTHWMISPGRKIDTNPLFPLDEVRAFAFGDGVIEPDDDAPADKPVVTPVPLPPVADGPVTVPALVKLSRKARILDSMKKVGHAIWSSLSITALLEWFGVLNSIHTEVSAYVLIPALAIGITLALGVALAAKWVLGLMVEDVQRGTYVPSGAVTPASGT